MKAEEIREYNGNNPYVKRILSVNKAYVKMIS